MWKIEDAQFYEVRDKNLIPEQSKLLIALENKERQSQAKCLIVDMQQTNAV